MLFYVHVCGIPLTKVALTEHSERDTISAASLSTAGPSLYDDSDAVHRTGNREGDGDCLQVQFDRTLSIGRERCLVGHLVCSVPDIEDTDAGEADTKPLAILDDTDRGPVEWEHGREKHPPGPRQREYSTDKSDSRHKRPDPEQESSPLLCRSDIADSGLVAHTDLVGLQKQKRTRIRFVSGDTAAVIPPTLTDR